MNAPILWIAFPFIIGIMVLFVSDNRYAGTIGGTTSAILSLLAMIFPIDTAFLLGPISIKISPAIQFFGRSFELNTPDGPLLALIYGLATLWFFGTEVSGTASRFVALGLMIVALLIASIAVEPFLFAALLIEVAAMLVIPLLVPPYQRPGRGVIRFMIYQTLAMPFILFSGWMLAGVEANPGNISATTQAGTMLGLGFAFLLAVFPLYSWIPLLTEETSPYVTGFLLWVLPTFTIIFALGFIDRYAWLRTSPELTSAIQFAGIITIASGGIFAALQRHIGRIMGYAAIAETGLLILVLGLRSTEVSTIAFLILIPRGLELTVWSLGLSIIKPKAFQLQFSNIQGLARETPIAVMAITVASLSMTGFPLLAGFPSRLAIWKAMAGISLSASFWIFIGMLGLLIAAVRTLAVFVMAEDNKIWQFDESLTQLTMLGLGIAGLFIMGLFPQTLQPFLASLPLLFEHISR